MIRFPIVLVSVLLLSSCLTPVAQAPRAVIMQEDLRFSATPPIGFPTREFTISKGRYIFWKEDMAAFYYTSEGAVVSRSAPGETAKKVPGGLGIDRSNGRPFVWKKDTSVGVMLPMGSATIVGQGGRDIQTFLAGIPHELDGKLVIEK